MRKSRRSIRKNRRCLGGTLAVREGHTPGGFWQALQMHRPAERKIRVQLVDLSLDQDRLGLSRIQFHQRLQELLGGPRFLAVLFHMLAIHLPSLVFESSDPPHRGGVDLVVHIDKRQNELATQIEQFLIGLDRLDLVRGRGEDRITP